MKMGMLNHCVVSVGPANEWEREVGERERLGGREREAAQLWTKHTKSKARGNKVQPLSPTYWLQLCGNDAGVMLLIHHYRRERQRLTWNGTNR